MFEQGDRVAKLTVDQVGAEEPGDDAFISAKRSHAPGIHFCLFLGLYLARFKRWLRPAFLVGTKANSTISLVGLAGFSMKAKYQRGK